ncbi:MAG TPA: response regulator [Polyangiaceae bacterium]|jgi:CheY-like chemotaxis protein
MESEPSRILLVEDDPTLARIYTRALRASGFLVDHAPDGVEGLDRLLRGDYDVVVSDVCMPRMGGLELLEAARRTRPDVPVVLMTAQLDADTYSRARALGSVRYLLKPVGLEQLANAVQTAALLRASRIRTHERRRALR